MKIVSIDCRGIEFDNGNFLNYYHCQEFYERVYADFYYIKDYNTIEGNKTVFDLEFDENILDHIEKIEDMGFNILDKNGNKIFVPCHDKQNGFYSSDLSLVYYDCKEDQTKELDITGCTEDDYY